MKTMTILAAILVAACSGDYDDDFSLDDATAGSTPPTFPNYTFDNGAAAALTDDDGPMVYFILGYPCDPPPDFLTYAVYDCAGTLVLLQRVLPTVPCRGWDELCLPANVRAKLELVAWTWTGSFYAPTAKRLASVGCP